MTGPVRVMVVDDHFLFAQAVASLIEGAAEFTVTGIAVTGPQALVMARDGQPNVVLLDYHLPGYVAADLLPRLKAAAPGMAVIVLTSDTSTAARERANAAGADAFMTKDQAIDDVLAVLSQVSARMSRTSLSGARQIAVAPTAALASRLESLARLAGADAIALFARIPEHSSPVWASHNLPVEHDWMDSAVRDLIAVALVRGTPQRRSAVGVVLANGEVAEWLVIEPIGAGGIAGALVALRVQGTFDGDERVASAAREAEGELAILANAFNEKSGQAPTPVTEMMAADPEPVAEAVTEPPVDSRTDLPAAAEPEPDEVPAPALEAATPRGDRRALTTTVLFLALGTALAGLALGATSLLLAAAALLVLVILIFLY